MLQRIDIMLIIKTELNFSGKKISKPNINE